MSERCSKWNYNWLSFQNRMGYDDVVFENRFVNKLGISWSKLHFSVDNRDKLL